MPIDRNCNYGRLRLAMLSMKYLFVAAFVMVSLLDAGAQSPDVQDEATAFAIKPPDESSPFFLTSVVDDANYQRMESPAKGYPRVPRREYNSALGKASHFFTDMFGNVQLGSSEGQLAEASLQLDPESPVIKDQREIEVTYTVRNNSKSLTRLDFPTSQRIEILTYNSSGSIVDRWSDDRAFKPEEGIVVINPRERIEFKEKISTRDMRPAQTYKTEASLKSQPDFVVDETVTPR
jgi:hypothetical protein